MKIKPANARGTRDFLPAETARRQHIFTEIKKVFRLFGFSEIETPAMENLSTLTGKYGDEGDKLLFKILNSGDYKKDIDVAMWTSEDAARFSSRLSEKGLRYDLTVPLARYVVQHQNDLVFPFKRYHIGPVWRADRPQKGRYREFYQCDADVIGSNSLLNELELTEIFAQVFMQLNIEVNIQINHRLLLSGIAKYFNADHRFEDFIVSLDKLDKMGFAGVTKELVEKGFDFSAVASDSPIEYFTTHEVSDYSDWSSLFQCFKNVFSRIESADGLQGVAELEEVCNRFPFRDAVILNPFLARGLSYYTGMVWEVTAKDVQIGTIASGGRYDKLTEMFGGKNMSGVGISFGIERIYDVMNELNLFPDDVSRSTKVLIVNFGRTTADYCFRLARQLRTQGIAVEFYPDHSKLDKQFNYANKKNIPYVIIAGEDEMNKNVYQMKDMLLGKQGSYSSEQIISALEKA